MSEFENTPNPETLNQNAPKPDRPLAYFLTFGTYGSWLRSNPSGRDRRPLPGRLSDLGAVLAEPPYQMDSVRRSLVLEAIVETCRIKGWPLFATHVRAEKVQTIVTATQPPDKVMATLKAYASRNLNQARVDQNRDKRWDRNGNTKYVWTPQQLQAYIDHVANEQNGPVMALFVDRDAAKVQPAATALDDGAAAADGNGRLASGVGRLVSG